MTDQLKATPAEKGAQLSTPPRTDAEVSAQLEAPEWPRAKPPSLRAAFIVLACAALVTFGGAAVALIGSNQATTATVSGLATPVSGVSLAAVDASGVLQAIASGGTPPSDILSSLVVPSGARIMGTTTPDAGVDQYDRSMKFQLSTTMSELARFYRTELKRARWSLLGTYPLPSAGTEVLAQREGSDGYEWEVGVLMTPVNPSISPSLAGDGQTSAAIGLTLRLFEEPDGS